MRSSDPFSRVIEALTQAGLISGAQVTCNPTQRSRAAAAARRSSGCTPCVTAGPDRRPALNPVVQIPEVLLEVRPVGLPRLAVDPRGRLRAQRPIRVTKPIDIDVVQSAVNLASLSFAATCRTRTSALDALTSWLCVRHAFAGPCSPCPAAFPPPAPPPIPRPCPPASQVLRGCQIPDDRSSQATALGLPLAARPAADMPPRAPSRTGHHRQQTGDHRASRFSRMEIPRMPGFSDRAGSVGHSHTATGRRSSILSRKVGYRKRSRRRCWEAGRGS
jgi:hypothetical protein